MKRYEKAWLRNGREKAEDVIDAEEKRGIKYVYTCEITDHETK